MTTIFDRLKQRMEFDDREVVSVDNQDWPMCRYGAMVPDSMSEDGTWSAFAESGPATGNIIWETEAVPVSILLPGEIIVRESIHTALIEEVQRLREVLEALAIECRQHILLLEEKGVTVAVSSVGSAEMLLAASDKRLEELIGNGPKDV